MKNNKNILIVEDDSVLLKVMKFKLEKEGYKVEVAKDAGEALAVIGHSKIDLIISDIMMPNISGLSLMSMVNDFFLRKVPVIIMSSLNEAEVRMSALGLGAYDFIVKPFNLNELCRKISLLLNKKDPLSNHKN